MSQIFSCKIVRGTLKWIQLNFLEFEKHIIWNFQCVKRNFQCVSFDEVFNFFARHVVVHFCELKCKGLIFSLCGFLELDYIQLLRKQAEYV